MENHSYYMQRCRELAAEARAAGESAVGSIVVLDGRVIGQAFEQSRQLRDITRHAEVLAVMDALQQTGSCAGATLYTTTEPCILCSYVIRHHRIALVVYETPCGELGGTGPVFNLLTTDSITSWGEPPLVLNFGALPDEQGH